MYPITVIGLGAGDITQLSVGIYRALKQAPYLIARTKEHPVVAQLEEEDVHMESFDEVYEQNDAFDDVYTEIVERLVALSKDRAITYAVPGHPLVAERTVQLLIEQERAGNVTLNIMGGNSFLDPIFAALKIDPIDGFQLVDGTDLSKDEVNMSQHVLIGQVYDAFIASEVKLTLMEKYVYDHPVTIVTAAGSSMEKLTVVPLYELDRETEVNNLTTVYVPPVTVRDKRLKDWSTFREIIAYLRSPEGCPWDREQSHDSLKKYVIEEAHELVEAINQEDDEALIEELGDVLLQVFLHAQIGEEDGYFTLEDVLQSIGEKMIRRHPHVFADQTVEDSAEVTHNWQAIKEAETGQNNSLLEGQERVSSSLLTSFNFQKSAAKVGFDWPNIEGAFEKFTEEWAEFQEAIRSEEEAAIIDEMGDVFFTLVNIARYLNVSPEEAMIHANQKFKQRFQYVEHCVEAGQKAFDGYTLEELDGFWQEAKRKEQDDEN